MTDLAHANNGSEQRIADFMEETIQNMVFAINNRYLEPGSPSQEPDKGIHLAGWGRVADDFNAEPEYLSSAAEQTYDQPLPLKLSEESLKVSVVGRERVKEMFRRIIDAHPNYKLKASDISTNVHEKARWAISYVSMETFDMPPGVIRPSLGVFEWKMIKGQWMLCKYEGMTGMVPE